MILEDICANRARTNISVTREGVEIMGEFGDIYSLPCFKGVPPGADKIPKLEMFIQEKIKQFSEKWRMIKILKSKLVYDGIHDTWGINIDYQWNADTYEIDNIELPNFKYLENEMKQKLFHLIFNDPRIDEISEKYFDWTKSYGDKILKERFLKKGEK